MWLVGKSRRYRELGEPFGRTLVREANGLLNTHDTLEMFWAVTTGGNELTMHRASIPIQASRNIANVEFGASTEQAASRYDSTVVVRGTA